MSTGVAAVMSQRRSRKGVGGRPKSVEPMIPIASLKGKKAFADWFEKLIAHCRLSGSTALEHGLIELAKAHKFPEPPPER